MWRPRFFYIAPLLPAGGDLRAPLRRLIIFASEDVGLADPSQVSSVVAASAVFDHVGLPEGKYIGAQLVVGLALASKSRAVYDAFTRAETAAKHFRGARVSTQLTRPLNLTPSASAAFAAKTRNKNLPERVTHARFWDDVSRR